VAVESKLLLGKHLQKLRRDRDISQEELAARIGIDPKSLSRLERGAHYPSLETLDRIRLELGLGWRDIFAFDKRQSIEELRAELASWLQGATHRELARVASTIKSETIVTDRSGIDAVSEAGQQRLD
jgi:transcriptional regulator with XRE-family HTH domain